MKQVDSGCSQDAADTAASTEEGVGEYCMDSLVADIESLALSSGIHPQHHGLFRMLANRFPFGIYYREHGKRAEVLAVLDLRRRPNWIRKELWLRAK